MNNHWILDILTDLRAFAQQNDLDALAEQLDQTRLLAAVELASLAGGADTSDDEATGTSRAGAGEVQKRT